MKTEPDLNKLLQLLLKNNLDFVIIGGFAGVVHGSSMVTRDLDLCMMMTRENLRRLRDCLAPYEPMHRRTRPLKPFTEFPEHLDSLKNLYLDTSLGTLDIIDEAEGVGAFEELSKRSISVDLFGHKVKVMSVQDLIDSKKALGRPKDLIMVEELEEILKRQPT